MKTKIACNLKRNNEEYQIFITDQSHYVQQQRANNFNIYTNKHHKMSQSEKKETKLVQKNQPTQQNNNQNNSQKQPIIPEQHPSRQLKENRLDRQTPKQQQVNSVVDAKNKLDVLIDDLNTKLVTHFKQKEEALLNQYKQELIQQQKKLTQLKNTTNEQQIRARMLQRKAELQKQRNDLIQTNMFFSQKCEQYKQVYTKLVQESRDLQKEIQFLDNQIAAASDKKIGLVDQIASIANTDRKVDASTLDIYTQKKIKLPEIDISSKIEKSTLQKTQNTNSVRKIARSLHIESKDKPKKSSSTKNFQRIDKAVFQKSTLEKVFQQCVDEVKNRRKTKRTMPILKGEQFTEFEKRAIMEIFLTNEEVKKRLYDIIFTEGERNFTRGVGKQVKTKISFEELGM